MFDYFYDIEGDQFSFYRVPKLFFQDKRFTILSAESRILYGILLDRVGISNKNGWKDERGRIYIIFPIEEIMECMGCGNKKAGELLKELEEKGGLIKRKRRGLGRPNIIYVKNFIKAVDNTEARHFQKCESDTSGDVFFTSQEVSKGHGNNTNMSNTDISETDPSIIQEKKDVFRRYEQYFNECLNVEYLKSANPHEHETIEGLINILAETCGSERKTIRIRAYVTIDGERVYASWSKKKSVKITK